MYSSGHLGTTRHFQWTAPLSGSNRLIKVCWDKICKFSLMNLSVFSKQNSHGKMTSASSVEERSRWSTAARNWWNNVDFMLQELCWWSVNFLEQRWNPNTPVQWNWCLHSWLPTLFWRTACLRLAGDSELSGVCIWVSSAGIRAKVLWSCSKLALHAQGPEFNDQGYRKYVFVKNARTSEA